MSNDEFEEIGKQLAAKVREVRASAISPAAMARAIARGALKSMGDLSVPEMRAQPLLVETLKKYDISVHIFRAAVSVVRKELQEQTVAVSAVAPQFSTRRRTKKGAADHAASGKMSPAELATAPIFH